MPAKAKKDKRIGDRKGIGKLEVRNSKSEKSSNREKESSKHLGG